MRLSLKGKSQTPSPDSHAPVETDPTTYHRVIEDNFHTDSINMGRTKDTVLAEDMAIEEQKARSLGVEGANFKSFKEFGEEKEIKVMLGKEALQGTLGDINSRIAREAAYGYNFSLDEPDALQLAKEETAQVVNDYDRLQQNAGRLRQDLNIQAKP